MEEVTVIGAGLAGCEAAYQLAERGIPVRLREMKPEKMTPAHKSGQFAELVCSNSLRGAGLENAVGLLKEELRRLGSLMMAAADATRVPAGGALAVDREGFSACVTKRICAHPLITVEVGEAAAIPAGEVLIATGPLTSDPLAAAIGERIGGGTTLNFFDAAAPLVSFESIDMDHAYFASRYGKGTADYINCALSEEEYHVFWEALCAAEEAEVHGFEDRKVFEGCMPVEVMDRYYRLKSEPRITFAGQMTGVEGYVESTASGFLAAVELSRRLRGLPPIDFPRETAVGALGLYISDTSVEKFQPMNINFGIIPPLGHRVRGKRNKNAALSERALSALEALREEALR